MHAKIPQWQGAKDPEAAGEVLEKTKCKSPTWGKFWNERKPFGKVGLELRL